MTTGTLFDIRRYSIHDGPGIRTAVFFKGCPLDCTWCHNPESKAGTPELMFRRNRCILCDECLPVCPQGAITREGDAILIDREKCSVCWQCAQVCPADALQVVGWEGSVDAVMAEIERDRSFYEESGGGVTFSGGEPLAQPEFLLALLRGCRGAGMTTVVDTCGYAPWDVFEKILPHVDLFLYDLKLMDEERHRRWTGASNRLILENLRHLAAAGGVVRVRIPVIPGINDDEANLRSSAACLSALNPTPEVELLPYHAIAAGKYAALGREDSLPDVQPPDAQHLHWCAEVLQESGIRVVKG